EAASGVGGAEHSENSLRGRGRLVPAWSPSLRMTELKIGKLWPDDVCEGIFRDRPCIAGTGVGTPEFAVVLDALQRAVDDGFEFVIVLHFASLGQAALCLFRTHPGGLAIRLIWLAHLVNFHEEGFDDEFLDAAGLPEDSLRVQIKMEVARFDGTERS